MLYSSLTYAKGLSIIGPPPLAVGLPLYLLEREVRDEGVRDEG